MPAALRVAMVCSRRRGAAAGHGELRGRHGDPGRLRGGHKISVCESDAGLQECKRGIVGVIEQPVFMLVDCVERERCGG